MSALRGDQDGFATLLPVDGDPWIKVQAVYEAPPGGKVHFDLDVEDPRAATDEAIRLGASEIGTTKDSQGTVVTLKSPGGLVFCFTTLSGEGHQQVRDGAPDLLDQVCIDVPSDACEAECEFWSHLTGWELADSTLDEFRFLERPTSSPCGSCCSDSTRLMARRSLTWTWLRLIAEPRSANTKPSEPGWSASTTGGR